VGSSPSTARSRRSPWARRQLVPRQPTLAPKSTTRPARSRILV
jgi:hypothetical protein